MSASEKLRALERDLSTFASPGDFEREIVLYRALPPLLTTKEVAIILSVSSRTVSRLIASGELPSLKFSESQRGTRRVSQAALRSFIARKESGE